MMARGENAALNTYRLLIEFDGTDFCGWQLQNGVRTVQGCIEEALRPLFADHPRIIGAGRTDSGVHATGMVAHFRTAGDRDAKEVREALNGTLPEDVRVLDASVADSEFNARFSARWRAYEYHIDLRPIALCRRQSWQINGAVDVERLNELAEQILGRHSFRSFAHDRPDEAESYESVIFRSEWIAEQDHLIYRIEGIRFLHGMVRLLVGTMIDISRGSLAYPSVTEVLAANDIRAAGGKAPPRGLVLTTVGYSEWPEP